MDTKIIYLIGIIIGILFILYLFGTKTKTKKSVKQDNIFPEHIIEEIPEHLLQKCPNCDYKQIPKLRCNDGGTIICDLCKTKFHPSSNDVPEHLPPEGVKFLIDCPLCSKYPKHLNKN